MKVVGPAVLLALLGCTPAEDCPSIEYQCNLRLYRQEVAHRPPDFSRAPRLARAEYLDRNIQNVVRENDDYTATALLRVLAAYPREAKEQFCSDVRIRGALRRRAASFRDPTLFGEYTAVLQQQVRCQF